ncbi:MAG TPA: response regulator transcription factor [Pyrinomonadaceae bacterium]|nr:response regulator transcription factor [Pyrinomonadaceae bacterium]
MPSANLNIQTPADRTISIAVVEDHHKLRQFLEFLFTNTNGYRCTGSFRTMEEALEKIPFDPPDLALVDIGLPGMSGIEGIKILKEKFPPMLLLMNTIFDDDERIFDALCAGASGYLLKKTPPAELLERVNEAILGGAPMSPEVARRTLSLFREIRPPERVDYDLTPHDLRLLTLVAEGHSYKTAGISLGVSPKTVSFHLQKIYEKLKVHSKSEAVSKVLRHRLIR